MTKDDKTEIRELITDLLNIHSEKIEGKFNLIDEKLERIELQTTKTNGRVTRLESVVVDIQIKDKEHIINCPIKERVNNLETETITTKTIRKMIIQGFTLAGVIAAIIYGLIEIISK